MNTPWERRRNSDYCHSPRRTTAITTSSSTIHRRQSCSNDSIASTLLCEERTSSSSLITSSPRGKWQRTERGWLPAGKLLVSPPLSSSSCHEANNSGTIKSSSIDSIRKLPPPPLHANDDDVSRSIKPIKSSTSSTTTTTTTASSSSSSAIDTIMNLNKVEKKNKKKEVEGKEKVDSIVTVTPVTTTTTTTTTKSVTKSYPRWEYGKIKRYTIPDNTIETNQAATMISKWIRGWYQRLRYRIMVVEYKIRTVKERYDPMIRNIETKIRQEKLQMNREINIMKQNTDRMLRHNKTLLKEADETIQRLRQHNRQLRQQNDQLAIQIKEYRTKNDRLEYIQYQGTTNFTNQLESHTQHIKETYEHLQHNVIPPYLRALQQYQESLELHQQCITTEKAIRIHYTKCIGKMISTLQNHPYCHRDPILLHDMETMVIELTEPPQQQQEKEKAATDHMISSSSSSAQVPMIVTYEKGLLRTKNDHKNYHDNDDDDDDTAISSYDDEYTIYTNDEFEIM